MCTHFVDISLVLDILIKREIQKEHCCDASSDKQRLQFLGCNIRNEPAWVLVRVIWQPWLFDRRGDAHGIFCPGFIRPYLGSPTIVQWPNIATSIAKNPGQIIADSDRGEWTRAHLAR